MSMPSSGTRTSGERDARSSYHPRASPLRPIFRFHWTAPGLDALLGGAKSASRLSALYVKNQGAQVRSYTSMCAAAVVFLSVASCRGRDEAARTGDSVRPAQPGTYASTDFQRLRWLEGRWVGRMEDDKRFYEQYRFADDSTIVMHSFRDSTFAQATDSSRITLRGSTVASEAATARWVAERLDTLGVEFAPDRGATNYFSWSKESPNAWTATLRWIDRDGHVRRVAYALQRMSP